MFKRVANSFPAHFLGTAVVMTFFLWVRSAVDRGSAGEWWSELFCAFGVFIGSLSLEGAFTGPRNHADVPTARRPDGLARMFSTLVYTFTGIAGVTVGYASVGLEGLAWTAGVGLVFNTLVLVTAVGSQRSQILREDDDTKRLKYIWIGATMFGVIGLATQVYLVSTFGVSPWLCLVGLVTYAYLLRWVSLAIYGQFTRPQVHVES